MRCSQSDVIVRHNHPGGTIPCPTCTSVVTVQPGRSGWPETATRWPVHDTPEHFVVIDRRRDAERVEDPRWLACCACGLAEASHVSEADARMWLDAAHVAQAVAA